MLRRTDPALWLPFMNINLMGKWRLPGEQLPKVAMKQNEYDNIKYFETKSRKEWDYQGIDERITRASALGDTSQREEFHTGPREDNQACFTATLSNDVPGTNYKRLYEHFDEYTQPGIDKKVAAAKAVREQWDADHFYYPGEAWKRNRPSFRSVPAELLNKQTWYHWIDQMYCLNEVSTTYRNRMWNPVWPPPGYKLPKFNTKREFIFGADEPSLISEIERWYWFKNWFENNVRQGPWEYLGFMLFALYFWAVVRSSGSNTKMKAMLNNQYYPGRQIVRSFGEPRDWTNERWWWQEPLETWPNQGEIWYCGEIRWKYINLERKKDAENLLRTELSGMRNDITPDDWDRSSGNRGQFYWMRYPGFGNNVGGSNTRIKPLGASAHNFKKHDSDMDEFLKEDDPRYEGNIPASTWYSQKTW